MRDGDLAILIPPKSKCDQFGLEWGQAPIYLRFRRQSPICAARAQRDLELCLPRHGREQREATALFTKDDGSPLSTANVDSLFKDCITQSGVARAATARYSPHSFRRYLACALKAQGASDSTIQALLRWKTDESLKLYSIINDETYADYIDGAGKANVLSVRTNALPRAELLDAAASFDSASSRLNAAAVTAEATSPDEDRVEEVFTDGDSDNGESVDAAPPPPPNAPPSKRRRSAKRAPPSGSSLPLHLAPLAADAGVGHHAIAPAALWPAEQCRENGGSGWDVVIDQVDRRLRAALVRFTSARDAMGKRYAREWLEMKSLRSGTTQVTSA